MVIDVLNMEPSLEHHLNCYGEYSVAIQDYDAPSPSYELGMDILSRFGTAPADELLELVDPYAYRDRLTMPKLGINATGDEFFVTDSAQFYFDDLLGTKYLRYVPNVGHSLGGYEAAIASAMPFYKAVATDVPPPAFTWDYVPPASSLRIDPPGATLAVTVTSGTPTSVKLYQAQTEVGMRDFRALIPFPPGMPTWSSTTINDGDDGFVDGVYTAFVEEPTDGSWVGFFMELKFPSLAPPLEYEFTTQPYVIPEVYPVFP